MTCSSELFLKNKYILSNLISSEILLTLKKDEHRKIFGFELLFFKLICIVPLIYSKGIPEYSPGLISKFKV